MNFGSGNLRKYSKVKDSAVRSMFNIYKEISNNCYSNIARALNNDPNVDIKIDPEHTYPRTGFRINMGLGDATQVTLTNGVFE